MTLETQFTSPLQMRNQIRAMKALFPLPSRFGQSTPVSVAYCRWMTVSFFLMAISAPAQEALRNSMAGDAAAEARTLQMQNQNYTFKNGDFMMLLAPSLNLAWNDNVNLSDTNAEDDFIVSPTLGITSSYPLTQRNLLQLNVTVGYNDYINHSYLSTWYLQSGSELSFDIYIKDFWINLHDQFSYVQDSSQNANVANTGSYGTFQNTAGLSGTWDLNDVTLALGYDHQNILSTSSQFDEINHDSEMFFARSGFKVHPKITVGLESTASFTTYDQEVLNDNAAYSIGVYADVRPDAFFRIQPRVGYTIYQFQHTSQSIQTSNLNSWYADLNITHQPTDFLSYSLDAGHEVSLGIQSDVTEDWYIRPSISWNIIRNLSLQTSFFYEYGSQGVGNILNNFTENYSWYGGRIGLGYPIAKRLTLGLSYQLTLRSSSIADRGYAQNVVGLQLTYRTP
jgi:outer membrane protein assembly factor BamA